MTLSLLSLGKLSSELVTLSYHVCKSKSSCVETIKLNLAYLSASVNESFASKRMELHVVRTVHND